MNKYASLLERLTSDGRGSMKCYGNSMKPILSNPSICHYEVRDSYQVGDIVFSKVKGRYIDAHQITKIGPDGRYLISNNRGHDNGWTRQVLAKVVAATDAQGIVKEFP